jgi:hypothetical protein
MRFDHRLIAQYLKFAIPGFDEPESWISLFNCKICFVHGVTYAWDLNLLG